MRRVRKSRARRVWSDAHQLQLQHKFDYFNEAWGDSPTPEVQREMWQAWKDCKDDIMDDHVQHFPCTRPWAWWQFDSSEPRDRAIDEREQLQRLGALSTDEIRRFERLESLNRVRASRSGFDA